MIAAAMPCLIGDVDLRNLCPIPSRQLRSGRVGWARCGLGALLIAVLASSALQTVRAADPQDNLSPQDGDLYVSGACGSYAASRQPQPAKQCWEGRLQANGQGNIYNDAVDIEFKFKVDASGTVTGRGYAEMTTLTQKMANCVITRAETPSKFPVEIGGRREGDVFKLTVQSDTPAQMTITQICPPSTQTRSGPISPFMGVTVTSVANYPQNDGGPLFPVISHVDDARIVQSTFMAASVSGMHVWGNIQIRCVFGCVPHKCDPAPGFVWITPANGKAVLYAAASTASPIVGNPPVGARLVYREVSNQNGDVWYLITPPSATPGWAPATDISCERPVQLPFQPHFPIIDPNTKVIPGTMAYTAAGRG